MEQRIDYLCLLSLLLCLCAAAKFPSLCEGRSIRHLKSYTHSKSSKHLRGQDTKAVRQLEVFTSLDSNYMGSPLSLPPFEYMMGPSSSPQDYPPFCVYPPPLPLTPMPPSGTYPTPILPIQSPPPPSTNPPSVIPNPPEYNPSPPETGPTTPGYQPGTPIIFPGPPGFEPSPPEFEPGPPGFEPSPPQFEPGPPGFEPSPPGFEPGSPGFEPTPPGSTQSPPLGLVPSPPEYVPGPPEFVPGPPIFLPPVVYPPPFVLTPPHGGTTPGLWCVAKPTVPDPIIQEAMNYACGSGADCGSIMPKGSCYQPDTLISHASFAFNSYWQRTKVAGGSCDFGGTAMLITRDPSYDGCRFIIS